MKTYFFTVCLLISISAPMMAQPVLPLTPKRPVTDVYFGKRVIDNYRWLEDMNSTETRDWFKAQADYTNHTLDQIPGRDVLIKTFNEYDALKSHTINGVIRRGGRYFYRKTLAGEKVGKIYMRPVVRQLGKPGPEQLLFDPGAYDKTKTYSVTNFIPSDDGRKLSIGLQEGGAELSTVRFLNVDTKTVYPESLTAVPGGGGTWTPDSKAMIYLPFNSANPQDPKGTRDLICRYHVVGSNPATDRKLFSREQYPDLGMKPEQYPFVGFDKDYTHIFGYLSSVDQRLNAFIAPASDLLQPTINWKRFAAPEDSIRGFVAVGNKMFLHSTKGALKGKVLVTDTQNPDVKTATLFLPEGQLNLMGLGRSNDFLFVTHSDGVSEQVRQYDVRTGEWSETPMSMTGTVRVWPVDRNSNDCLLWVSSWNKPATLYDYQPATRKPTVSTFHVNATYPGVDQIVVEEVEVPSHDGVMVPLSLIYKKGTPKDGSATCVLEGYGAYSISSTPSFVYMRHALALKNVVYAIAHIRGGGEKGQAWYKGGYKTTKPNTWKDFIACAEWLINNKYTSSHHLAGMGTSAGGILIGRSITERPDLFAAAINNVGATNILRMENTPNGPVNTPEFGTVKDSVECMALLEMDAMHHVREGVKYPAVINVGGWNDPRVIVWQPGKMAAALQNASTSGKPVLMQVNYDNGHFTEDKQVTFRNFANMFAFVLWQAGHPEFQPATVGAKPISSKE